MDHLFDLSKVIFALVAVLGLFYLVMKFFKTKDLYNQTSQIRVLEKCYLGKDKLICLVEVVDQILLVSVTNQEIKLIKEVELPDEVDLSQSKQGLQGLNLFKKGKDKKND